MFGVSFPELLVLGTVALLVLGPEKLPGMLRTMGQWIAKMRRLTTEVRYQSGIDDVLRAEGFEGGLNELRSMMRGGPMLPSSTPVVRPPLREHFVPDKSREYPIEGPDAHGALPEDLVAPAPGDGQGARAPEPSTPAAPAEPTLELASANAEPGLAATPDPAPRPAVPRPSKPAPPEANG